MNLNDMYRDARRDAMENGTDGNTNLPDGAYNVTLTKLERKEFKAGGHGVRWRFEVVDGECKGRKQFKMSFLNDKGISFFASDLVRAKLSLDSLDSLDYFISDANENCFPRPMLIRVVTNGDYTNTYINECEVDWFPGEPGTGMRQDDPF